MASLKSDDGDLENNAELQDFICSFQKEELEALSAIYGEDFLLENDNEEWMYFDDNTGCKQGLLLSAMPTFSITIRPDNSNDSGVKVTDAGSSSISQNSEARLIITFQPDYPTSAPPLYQLSIPWLRGGQKQLIANALEELYLEHLGESIVYIWVEKLRELVRVETDFSANPHNIPFGTEKSVLNQNTSLTDLTAGYDETSTATCTSTAAIDPFASEYLIDQFSNSLSFNPTSGAAGDSCDGRASNLYDGESTQCTQKSLYPVKSLGQVPPIRTGTPLTDRKSTFQAHVAPVNDTSEIRMILDELYQNKKIASATHNMYAYRIFKAESKTWFQDCDDDGETHARSRLLHLLQILDCRNVIVVVSRWYGGIQLHGDRFKHINNVARQSLSEFGFISATAPDGKKVDDSKSKKGSTKR